MTDWLSTDGVLGRSGVKVLRQLGSEREGLNRVCVCVCFCLCVCVCVGTIALVRSSSVSCTSYLNACVCARVCECVSRQYSGMYFSYFFLVLMMRSCYYRHVT